MQGINVRDPKALLKRATELRKLAYEVSDETARRVLLDAARDYELLSEGKLPGGGSEPAPRSPKAH